MASREEHSTAIVTGGGSERGIGRATARRLARDGWSVGIVDMDGEAARRVAAELGDEFGVQAVGEQADVSSEGDVDRAVAAIEDALPPVEALVNAAGISSPVPFLETDLTLWERVLRINATGTFLVTKRVMPGFVDRGYGRVVSIGSTAAQNGGGTYSKSAYAAAKGAIESFSRAVALEMAPRGVTVNVVAPATIDTDIMGGRITDDRKPTFLAQLPVGRIGTTDEVAALIEFLIGSDAGYITGATYNINGGIRIG
ncbi:SDR family NAD(P)-dependent oxidoreductase [Microbacterium sp. YJN-G]|uniref:SDR family NAD(P)-dependent oxidoreductase n=1 Tax=Microbacterium sp. YJN-G TaxID=2763257 RepID=UPI001877C4C3|nr:SDR family oxidoreductase [Microbacterium sp. YJN-G]